MNSILACQIVLAVSLGGMLFIFLRVLPLLPEFKPKPVSEEKKPSFRLKAGFEATRKKIGGGFHQWGKRSAHRIKVLVLKVDNFLTSYLKKAREKEIYLEKIHLSRRKKTERTLELEKVSKRKKSKKRLEIKKKNK